MIQVHRLLIGIFLLSDFQMVNSIVCYQCTDCPEPFIETYPYVTITNNTNFLAQCTKTVVNLGDDRRLISKGSVFFCPTETSSANTQIYCCNSDYCNSSNHLDSSMLLFYLSCFILIRTYL
ncbi:unnamed protein product [Rotaria sp. Silwood1]|nr:unnamed protein product [Rotaria sp. Silwood1]CAF3337344.1 unnamed protein product [Rotaria sp. Silwood1]CAF3341726.1 unnamed protein product [Rotaria sp. Silwood1]CAF4892810.1 unnamed protein product [Rotaria sp. Silwood1]